MLVWLFEELADNFACLRNILIREVIVLRRRLHLAAVHGMSSRMELWDLFRFVARRFSTSSAVQSQAAARPAVRCVL